MYYYTYYKHRHLLEKSYLSHSGVARDTFKKYIQEVALSLSHLFYLWPRRNSFLIVSIVFREIHKSKALINKRIEYNDI